MRARSTAGLGAFLLVTLAAAAASASEGKSESVKGERGASPTGAPAGSIGAGAAESSVHVGAESSERDKVTQQAVPKKAWEVGATWEAHGLLRQNDLQGNAADKFFNYFYVFGRVEFLKYNRVTLRAGLYQRFLADPQESGARLDDVVLSYTRTIPLPEQFKLMVSGSVFAPTSFVSQKEGVITAPRLTLQLDKGFGRHVLLTLRPFGEAYIQQYTSMQGGSTPNPIARVGGSFEASVSMPFHPPLSLGAAFYTGYTWYYDANAKLPAGAPGLSQDATYAHQPTQQSYGGEIYVRYALPSIAGVKPDMMVALANGDPSLGYTSRLHDGVSHLYLFYRLTTEVYGAIAARY